MIKKSDVLQRIEDQREMIKKLGVKRIGIFGSFARNSATKGSDIDIVVEFRPNAKTFDRYMELKELLEKALKRRVDLVTREAIKPSLKLSILKDTQYAGL